MDIKVTLNQIGGYGRLVAMVGAFNFIKSADSVQFKFKGSKVANHLKITLAGDDTYTMTFGKIRGLDFKPAAPISGVYADNLRPIFERTTGLYLSL